MHTTNQDLFNISYNSNNNKFCSLAMCFNKGVGLEFHRLVFSRFFDICGNLGNAKRFSSFLPLTDLRNPTILV